MNFPLVWQGLSAGKHVMGEAIDLSVYFSEVNHNLELRTFLAFFKNFKFTETFQTLNISKTNKKYSKSGIIVPPPPRITNINICQMK